METRLEAIKDQIVKMDEKVEKIQLDVLDIKLTMGINTQSLDYHIKRTDDLQDMAREFKNHMLIVNTIFKVLVSIGAVLMFLDQLGILDKIFRLVK